MEQVITVYSAALLLFLVLDPLANIPFFLAALKKIEPRRHKKIILRELLIALAVMVAFLFAGRYLMQLLGISDPSLSIAGGIILFIIAIRMIFPPPRGGHEEIDDEPFIFPLAVPFVAGPSALATILLLSSREPERWLDWLLAILIAWVGAAAILYGGIDKLAEWMGPKGLTAMERLMGMLLTLVAVQMFMSGVQMFNAL